MSCGVGQRQGSDPELLWLWCRLATAAPIHPLAWELPYATGAALKRKKTKEKRKRECEDRWHLGWIKRREDKVLLITGENTESLFFFFRVAHVAYRCSQARAPIGAIAASNTRSESCLPATPQLMTTPDP